MLNVALPDTALLPLQAPDAVQLVAPVLLQLRAVCPPGAMLVGLPLKLRVAANASPQNNATRQTNKVLKVVLVMTSRLGK